MSKKHLMPADILLPKGDFESWSVIACDQYTSEPEYWKQTEENAKGKASALNIVLPEVYLSGDDGEKKVPFTLRDWCRRILSCPCRRGGGGVSPRGACAPCKRNGA